jgi:hypothetical protein
MKTTRISLSAGRVEAALEIQLITAAQQGSEAAFREAARMDNRLAWIRRWALCVPNHASYLMNCRSAGTHRYSRLELLAQGVFTREDRGGINAKRQVPLMAETYAVREKILAVSRMPGIAAGESVLRPPLEEPTHSTLKTESGWRPGSIFPAKWSGRWPPSRSRCLPSKMLVGNMVQC